MASRSVMKVPRLLQRTLLTNQLGSLSSIQSRQKGTHAPGVDITSETHTETERTDPADANNLMDIGIRKIFNAEYDIFRSSARKFCREEFMPNVDKYEQQRHPDPELWLKAGEQGLLGLAIPEEHHGMGGDLLHSAVFWEEMGYVNDSSGGFGVHSEIVMPYISRYGTQEQIDRILPKMASGETVGSIAMTEPQAGSDLQGIRTNAKRDGDDWILNGSKVFITNGWLAGVVIVVAITNPEAKSPAHGISLFVVEDGMPGFRKGRPLKKMGSHGQDTVELFFDDVRLPMSSILGGEEGLNQGFYYLMQELPIERLFIAAMGLGHAEWMFEETRQYVRQRKAFRKTIADLQTVQHKLAEMKTSICVARSFIDDCLVSGKEEKMSAERASMAKYWCTDLQNKVAYDCVQLHGGWGYMWEYGISRAYVSSRVQSIYGGSNEIMKELIARKIVRG